MGQVKKVEDDYVVLNTRVVSNEKDLLQHKLEAEKQYASKEDVRSSLARIHDRLDEMGNDIKILIKSTK